MTRAENMHARRSDAPRAVSSAATHCGYCRTVNQDAYLDRPEIGLWAVADGVGGLVAGEKASRAVVDALASIEEGEQLADEIANRIIGANDDLRLGAVIDGKGAMASTVAVLTTDRTRRKFICLWAGDSRVYRLRAGAIEQVTRDHTPLQDFLDAGSRPPSGLQLAHALSRAVGTEESLRVDRVTGAIEPGDTFLLCTDGLSKPVRTARIRELLSTSPIRSAAQRLVAAALHAGGPDNVTAVVIAFPGEDPVSRKVPQAMGSNRRLLLTACFFLAIGLAAPALLAIWSVSGVPKAVIAGTRTIAAGGFVLTLLIMLSIVCEGWARNRIDRFAMAGGGAIAALLFSEATGAMAPMLLAARRAFVHFFNP